MKILKLFFLISGRAITAQYNHKITTCLLIDFKDDVSLIFRASLLVLTK